MADGPFCRIYYRDLEDNYPEVWWEPQLFFAYAHLLARAEADPMLRPDLPKRVNRKALDRLVDMGLVEMQAHERYTIRGLAADRARRTASQRAAADARWHPRADANGHAHASPQAMPNRTEPNPDQRGRAPARGNGKVTDEREWTEEQRRAAYEETMKRRTGIAG